MAADLQHVLEAGGGEEDAAGEGAFEDGVGGDGGAVEEEADVGEGEGEALRGFGDAGEEAFRGVGGGGGGFPGVDGAGAGVEDLEVGEGATDVNGDADGFGGSHIQTHPESMFCTFSTLDAEQRQSSDAAGLPFLNARPPKFARPRSRGFWTVL